MARHGRRIGIVVAAIMAALLTYAASAAACDEPTIGLSRTQAGPGDIVPFSFTGTDDDATYTVSIGDQVLASGSSSGDTVAGTFVMPNMGSKTERVTVEGYVSDPAESPWGWKHPAYIEYVAPAAAPPTTGTGTAGASPSHSSSTPAATNQPSQAPSSSAAHGPTPTPPAGSGRPTHHPRPSGGPSHHSGPGSGHPHSTLPAGRSGGVLAASTGSARTSMGQRAASASPMTSPSSARLIRAVGTSTATNYAVSRLNRSGPTTTASRAGAQLGERPLRTQPGPTATAMPPLSAASAATAVHNTSTSGNGGGPGLPLALALGLLALGGVAGGGAAAARRLSRRPSQPPPTSVMAGALAADTPPTADSILEGLDLDAELRKMLEQAEHDARTAVEAEVPAREVTSSR